MIKQLVFPLQVCDFKKWTIDFLSYGTQKLMKLECCVTIQMKELFQIFLLVLTFLTLG